jgi:glycosyltransferase involved in cell wall biosynthesis
VAAPQLPSFDLVIATVGRVEELASLLASLERQTYRHFRVLVVDQNADDRIAEVVRGHALDLHRLTAPRGLSRARNAALLHLRGDVIAFPDDDCVYSVDLLERVARRFAADPALDGVTGRAVDRDGRSSPSWNLDGALLTRENLWNRAISYTIFLRATVVERVGAFDEQLGLGAGTPWSSGEEIDYLVRAIGARSRIEYDPDLVVVHEGERRPAPSVGVRDGASIGYVLRKHRYPLATVATMLVRPVGGALVALARRDAGRARFHLSTLRGRALGYRARSAA